jgi:nucleoid-associated protein YgaU
MADRVKYFVLGLLFLVVAAVIAHDQWNAKSSGSTTTAENDSDGWVLINGSDEKKGTVDPLAVRPDPVKLDGARREVVPPAPLNDRPLADDVDDEPVTPAPEQKPLPKTEPKPDPAGPQTEPKPQPAAPRTHVVRRGESLEAIAMRYYKTRDGVAWIAAANGIKDPNHIRFDDKLVIPARKELAEPSHGRAESAGAPPLKAKAAAATEAGAAAERPSKSVPSTHRVKAGDTDLYAICRRYYGAHGEGERVARIMELNQLYSAELQPGTLLRLPPK